MFNAVHDVKRISDILIRKYDFELIEAPILNENATREKIINSLTQLAATLTVEDNLVIYFAGHGVQNLLSSHGYWVPFDGNDLPSSYIPNSSVKDAIEAVEAKHVFLISDSCYSGTFLTRTRSIENTLYYDKLDAVKSRWVLASGGEEKVSDGFEPGKGSPFCNELFDFLDANTNKHLSVIEIINHVEHSTRKIAKQQPAGAFMQNIGHEGGQMILILNDNFSKNINDSFVLEKKETLKEDSLQFSAGKELLIIKSFVPEADYLIVELFRFDDDGNQKNVFRGNIVKPANSEKGKDDEWELIQRFATISGLNRYLDENKDFSEKNKIVALFTHESIDSVESSEAAKKHYKKLQQLKAANTTLMNCLHCRKSIITNDSLFVEIDEEGLNAAVGNIHKECIRPADRILGKSFYPNLKDASMLINFDFNEWINLLKRGQGFITPVKQMKQTINPTVIAWNPEHKFNNGNYCLRLIAEDNKSSFAHLGKDIYRIKESEIEAELEFFKDRLKQSEESGDPMCVTSEKRIFGNYKYLETIKSQEEKLFKIVRVEKAKYSSQFSQINPNIDNDYTPLCLVIDPHTEDIINFGNCIPVISDPLIFDDFHNNWNNAGYKLEKCELRIIKSDIELDHYLHSFLEDGMQPILDPLFDNKANLTKGFFISNFKELIKKKKNSRVFEIQVSTDGFKKGQMVDVVLPGKALKNNPTGILACDEFEDENGKICSIFIPIENGKQLDLSYKMPVELFRLKQSKI